MKSSFFFFFTFFFLSQFFLFSSVNSQSPGTPSSSYNFDYRSKEKINDSQELNILQENINVVTNIIVQGNKRVESNLIINESQIQTLDTNEKGLSKAVKNLYKTGYFDDVQIFKDKNLIYINVKENPVIESHHLRHVRVSLFLVIQRLQGLLQHVLGRLRHLHHLLLLLLHLLLHDRAQLFNCDRHVDAVQAVLLVHPAQPRSATM